MDQVGADAIGTDDIWCGDPPPSSLHCMNIASQRTSPVRAWHKIEECLTPHSATPPYRYRQPEEGGWVAVDVFQLRYQPTISNLHPQAWQKAKEAMPGTKEHAASRGTTGHHSGV